MSAVARHGRDHVAAAAGETGRTYASPQIAIVEHDERIVSMGYRCVRTAVTRFPGVNLGI
jgi:hypothetical protein